ncbi:MAG TPA: XdhC family protein, partial [Segetibacter sp.]|nr:XdhC family protein [Segetibacter sp.]
GSAYRRPGARMLVSEDGKLTGAISGGCLEGDALRKAQMVMLQKKPMLVTYDTTDEDDAKLGVGLGCNGIISILIEPLSKKDANNSIELLKAFLSKRQTAVLVTLFSLEKKVTQPGTCLILTEDGRIKSSIENEYLQTNLIEDAHQVLISRTSQIKTYNIENSLTGFIELLEPAVSIVIFGAGNDSIPLVQMARVLGWETTVADGRSNYATRERFPLVNSVIVTKPENFLSQINFDDRTVAVLITHNYNYDIAVLRQLVTLNVSYIGVLGPKKKLDRMLEELKEGGMLIDEETTKNVFGPAGLDIGAETSDEIALSILSEIQAVLSKRTGSSLREKKESIHPRDAQRIIQESAYNV